MSNLLREYIQTLLIEVKGPDQKLLSNQTIGWAAEWAVYEAINGGESLFSGRGVNATPNDGRLIKPWSAASPEAKKILIQVYRALINAAKGSLGSFGKKQPNASSEPPPGAGNRPVDVTSDVADIHVKYNDAARLVGFQRQKIAKEEMVDPTTGKSKKISTTIPSSRTAAVFDKAMDTFISEIITKAKRLKKSKYLAGGLLKKPSTLSTTDLENPEWKVFNAAKESYQQVVTQGEDRERLYKILSAAGIEKAILGDINDQLFGATQPKKGSAKQTVFAKFYAPEITSVENFDIGEYVAGLQCKFINYKRSMGLTDPLKDLQVIEVPPQGFDNSKIVAAAMKTAAKQGDQETLPARKFFKVGGQTTTFYLITGVDQNKDKVYFRIEFRLDGEGHPPQLKTGPDLDSLAI